MQDTRSLNEIFGQIECIENELTIRHQNRWADQVRKEACIKLCKLENELTIEDEIDDMIEENEILRKLELQKVVEDTKQKCEHLFQQQMRQFQEDKAVELHEMYKKGVSDSKRFDTRNRQRLKFFYKDAYLSGVTDAKKSFRETRVHKGRGSYRYYYTQEILHKTNYKPDDEIWRWFQEAGNDVINP
jgi:hypothetical protein